MSYAALCDSLLMNLLSCLHLSVFEALFTSVDESARDLDDRWTVRC